MLRKSAMKVGCFCAGALVLLTGAAPLYARWESAKDNKASVELQGMNNQQLFNEAFDVCTRRAMIERSAQETGEPAEPALGEASGYLNVIYPYVRERNGGSVPAWMSELFTAHTTKECQDAFHTFVNTTRSAAVAPAKPQTTGAAAPRHHPEPRRHAVVAEHKPTPVPARPQWSDQLPPWLAPD